MARFLVLVLIALVLWFLLLVLVWNSLSGIAFLFIPESFAGRNG